MKFRYTLLGLLLVSSFSSAASYNFRQVSLGLLAPQVAAPVVPPALPTVSWDSLSGSAITVDPDGLAFTVLPSTTGSVRASAAGKTAGKWYWEVKVVSGPVKNILIGIQTASGAYTTGVRPADETGSLGAYCEPTGCNSSYPYATYKVGDVVGLAYNVPSKILTVYRNNTKQLDIDVLGAPGGTVFYPAVWVQSSTAGGTKYVANFGSSAFTYTPPAGFTKLEP